MDELSQMYWLIECGSAYRSDIAEQHFGALNAKSLKDMVGPRELD